MDPLSHSDDLELPRPPIGNKQRKLKRRVNSKAGNKKEKADKGKTR